jgi:hypothetical protein
MVYKELDPSNDIQTNIALVTSGIFQDGASSITAFYTSSTQYTNTGDYSIDVYRYDPSNNASASVQFGVAYGHVHGSGSLGTVGATGDRTSAAVFGQFNNLVNPPETSTMKFSGKSGVKHFYVLSFNRARIREEIEPGGWELHLNAAGSNRIKLIDDSSTSTAGNTDQKNFSPEYNIVSGTLVGGAGVGEAASTDSTNGSYGLFYPTIGVMLLNPDRLGVSPASITTAQASNTDSRNQRTIFNSIVNGAYFQCKRVENINSTHYFIRANATSFNATTNETYYTQSVSGVRQVIPGLLTDPKVYITSVGLYNDANQMLAVAKLSRPILKSNSREALIKVKLDF